MMRSGKINTFYIVFFCRNYFAILLKRKKKRCGGLIFLATHESIMCFTEDIINSNDFFSGVLRVFFKIIIPKKLSYAKWNFIFFNLILYILINWSGKDFGNCIQSSSERSTLILCQKKCTQFFIPIHKISCWLAIWFIYIRLICDVWVMLGYVSSISGKFNI